MCMCLLCQVKPIVSQYLKERKLPYQEDSYISRLSLFFHRYQELMVFAPPISDLVGVQWWWDEEQKTREHGHWHDGRPNFIYFQLVHEGIRIKFNMKLGSQPNLLAECDIIYERNRVSDKKKMRDETWWWHQLEKKVLSEMDDNLMKDYEAKHLFV